MNKLVTIGVYGFSESGFFGALEQAAVDTFCDIRYRRGVRGSQYAFVNSRRLQARLTNLGIRYLHFRDLAPSQALRDRQAKADRATRTAKRQRKELSREFVEAYQQECLSSFDSGTFLTRLQLEPQRLTVQKSSRVQRQNRTAEFHADASDTSGAGIESGARVKRVLAPSNWAEPQVVALFCVELEPAACHRWLLAARLQQDLNVEVVHLKPS